MAKRKNDTMDWRKAKRLARRERQGLSNSTTSQSGHVKRPHKAVRQAVKAANEAPLFGEETQAERIRLLDKNYRKYYEKAVKRLPKNKIFSKDAFEAALEGEVAKGRNTTPGGLLRRQLQDGLTDKQINAMWAVHQREFPGKYKGKNDFIAGKGWKDIDMAVERLRERLEAEGIDATDALVYRYIYSPGL